MSQERKIRRGGKRRREKNVDEMTLSKYPLKYLSDTGVIKILAVCKVAAGGGGGGRRRLAERCTRKGAPRSRRKRKKPEIR